MLKAISEFNEISERREWSLVLVIILINVIIKLIPATILELGNDEVYYWTYALFPDWSHFDHPPMVGLTIQLFSLNLTYNNELIMRLGSLVFSSVNIIILYALVKKIASRQAALFSILLFTSSFYFNIISGLFILPDTPLMLFVLLALYFGMPVVVRTNLSKTDGYHLILFGFFTGLAFLSKYSALFLWTGFGLYILFHNRQWFRKPSLYLSVLATLIMMIPVLYWNINNNFISFTFHSHRTVLNGHPDLQSFAIFNIGQLFYQNPVCFAVFAIALVSTLRRKMNSGEMLIIYLSMPLILIFTLVSVFNDTLPHWTGPSFIGLIILSGEWLSGLYNKNKMKAISLVLTANVLFFIAISAATVQIIYGSILPFQKNSDPTKTGKNDFTLDMYGWDQARIKFESFLAKENISKTDYPEIKILSNRWFPAAHIDYYIAYPLKIDLIVAGNLESAHKYKWINETRDITSAKRIYYLTPSQYYFPPEGLDYPAKEIIPKDTLRIIRGGETVKNIFIYQLK